MAGAGKKVASGMDRAKGVMQVLETVSELFSCTAKYAVKKRDKTSGYTHGFISQAEQFIRTLPVKSQPDIDIHDCSRGFRGNNELNG